MNVSNGLDSKENRNITLPDLILGNEADAVRGVLDIPGTF